MLLAARARGKCERGARSVTRSATPSRCIKVVVATKWRNTRKGPHQNRYPINYELMTLLV